jgi:hypothetical protein
VYRPKLIAALALAVAGILLGVGAGAAPGPGGWDQVGTGGAPNTSALNGVVLALNTERPGVMYVGGNFTDAGGDPNADYIAQWDGKGWKALGAAKLNGQVQAIAYRDGKVYVGGTFTSAGGSAASGFAAVWNGSTWAPVCKPSGPGANVYALAISGSTLYIGGAFQNGAGIPAADYLLACDVNTGAARTLVTRDGYVSSTVSALALDSRGTLYAGGNFFDFDGIKEADGVAAYRNGSWSALGSGPGPGGGAITGYVRDLTIDGTNVYVATDATDVAGIPQADHIAKWDGSAWSAVGSAAAGGNGIFPPTSTVYSVAVLGSKIYAGGQFQNANGNPLADNLVVFDGKAWGPVANGGSNGPINAPVFAFAQFGGKLYAGGNFTGADGNPTASFLASYSPGGAPGGGTTTTPGGAAPPATGTPTGTVLVNGAPFTGGQVAYNSTVDVTRGSLALRTDTGTITVNGRGVTSVFVLARATDKGRSITELRLTRGNFAACPRRKTRSASQTAPTATVRQVWGNAKGRFRTRGRYSVATVRGTNWLTADRCDGTLTRVRQGVVQVTDPPGKLVTVRAGRSYLARP